MIPVRTLSCPAWEVQVVDKDGHPVSGMTVRLSYQNYSAESQSHEVDAITDQQGHASFEAHSIRASVATRTLAILSSARDGVHADFGPHAYVYAFGRGLGGDPIDKHGYIVNWTGSPSRVESRIEVAPDTN